MYHRAVDFSIPIILIDGVRVVFEAKMINLLTKKKFDFTIKIPHGGILRTEEAVMEYCEHCKMKHRTEQETKTLINRLNRIEGQVRGVKGMVENDVYCTDILVQVSAITSALNSFTKELLASHIRTCVADDIRRGNDEVVDELVATLQKLMK